MLTIGLMLLIVGIVLLLMGAIGVVVSVIVPVLAIWIVLILLRYLRDWFNSNGGNRGTNSH